MDCEELIQESEPEATCCSSSGVSTGYLCVCFARRQQPEQAAAETGVMDEAFYSVWTCNKFTLSSRDDPFACYAARVTPVLLFVDLIWEHVQIDVLQFTKCWSSGTPSGARWGGREDEIPAFTSTFYFIRSFADIRFWRLAEFIAVLADNLPETS